MAVSNSESTKYQVAGDGNLTAFATGLVAATTAEIAVWITDTDGVVTAQVSGVDYTFTSTGGLATITFNTAPAATDTVTFLRQTSIQQALDLTFNERLPSIQLEATLDKLVRMIRDLDTRGVLRFPDTEPAGNSTTLSAPADRAGKVIYFDETTGEMTEELFTTLGGDYVTAAAAEAADAAASAGTAAGSASAADSSAIAAAASESAASDSADAAAASESAAAQSVIDAAAVAAALCCRLRGSTPKSAWLAWPPMGRPLRKQCWGHKWLMTSQVSSIRCAALAWRRLRLTIF
jgi:hypothetical protein